MDRVLLVGINAYPFPLPSLQGCLNDVNDVAMLAQSLHFSPHQICLITDNRATKKGILDGLHWLINNSKKGDQLLFHYSGHGAQLPVHVPNTETDNLNEAICPVDFDWTPEHSIIDEEFHALFVQIPREVELVWVSDSCHSGDLERELVPSSGSRPRHVIPPTATAARIEAVKNRRGIDPPEAGLDFVHVVQDLHGALIAACKSDQRSLDANFEGRPNGAFTYFLLERFRANPNAPVRALVEEVRTALNKQGYSQEPQLEGSRDVMLRPLLRAQAS